MGGGGLPPCVRCVGAVLDRSRQEALTQDWQVQTSTGYRKVVSESSVSALVHRFTEDVWNGRQLDELEGLADDDYRLRNLSDDSVPVRTRAELRAHIEEWLAAFPDLHMQETDHLASGSRVVSVVRVTGTHTGRDFQGFRAAGARIDVRFVAIFDCADGRLTGHGTLVDTRRLLQQLAP